MAPWSSYAFTARMEALIALRRWEDAEASARETLALDPPDSGASNPLSMALRLQGRTAENAEQIAGMLARAPQDAVMHDNAGWNALQRGTARRTPPVARHLQDFPQRERPDPVPLLAAPRRTGGLPGAERLGWTGAGRPRPI